MILLDCSLETCEHTEMLVGNFVDKLLENVENFLPTAKTFSFPLCNCRPDEMAEGLPWHNAI
jgi:hypothetical protein